MERSSALKKGLKLAVSSVFLAAALLTTGCGQNALMNPVGDEVGGEQVVNGAGQEMNPAGQEMNP